MLIPQLFRAFDRNNVEGMILLHGSTRESTTFSQHRDGENYRWGFYEAEPEEVNEIMKHGFTKRESVTLRLDPSMMVEKVIVAVEVLPRYMAEKEGRVEVKDVHGAQPRAVIFVGEMERKPRRVRSLLFLFIYQINNNL